MASWTWSALLGDFVSTEALMLAYATSLVAILIVIIAPRPEQLAISMVIGATAVAVIAISQWFGLDPFALAGWVAPIDGASARLRVYSTLGNPNFVAALLAASLPLSAGLFVSRRHRLMLGAAAALQLLGLIATGSRAGALGLLAAAFTFAVFAASRKTRVLVASVGLAAGLAAIALSSARPLGGTLAGRAYIVRVAAPHAFEAPLAGRGPGAFEFLYPGWERASRSGSGSGSSSFSASGAAISPFAGPQQHAHNDYLEALIERGVAGPVTILSILATCFWNGWRRRTRASRQEAGLLAGTLAMMAAIAAIALVDFPLVRPAEATFWWCGVALIALTSSEDIEDSHEFELEGNGVP
jgi:putative inorganic carbon (hco3(-)) transporter